MKVGNEFVHQLLLFYLNINKKKILLRE